MVFISKLNINFNGKSYSIDESFIEAASTSIKTYLTDVIGGSDSTINFDGTDYSIDSVQLESLTNDFVSRVDDFYGDGYTIDIDSIKYSIDSEMYDNAVSNMQDTIEDITFTPIGTWLFNDTIYIPEDFYGKSFDLAFSYMEQGTTAAYMDTISFWLEESGISYYGSEYSVEDAYSHTEGWFDYTYQTIEILETPSDEILAWLKENATKIDYEQIWEQLVTDKIVTVYKNELITCDKERLTGKLVIPNSVTSIRHSAFFECTNLVSVSIPDSVTTIGDDAFYACYNLKSIYIGARVDFIGAYCFQQCNSLETINVSKNNATYCSIEGNLLSKNGQQFIQYAVGKTSRYYVIPDSVINICSRAFAYCSTLKSVTMPASTTNIGDRAFWGCSNLSSIIFGNNVTSIDEYAFSGCASLVSVAIPNSVISIVDGTFSYCSGLTSVTIGNGVTTIGNYAFGGCSNLTSVTIPNSVTTIGDSAFYSCSKLKDVYYTGTAEEWAQISIGNSNSNLTGATIHYNTLLVD